MSMFTTARQVDWKKACALLTTLPTQVGVATNFVNNSKGKQRIENDQNTRIYFTKGCSYSKFSGRHMKEAAVFVLTMSWMTLLDVREV